MFAIFGRNGNSQKDSMKKRTLRTEQLEDRTLLAVTAGALQTLPEPAELPGTGQVLVVNTLQDVVDEGDVFLSLREAVAAAADGDTVTFADGLEGTITLAAQIEISHSITITGNNAITIDGGGAVRHFIVTAGNAAISDLTLANGNAGSDWGGAIRINAGASVNAVNLHFDANNGYAGGTICCLGTFTASNSTFNGGNSSYSGYSYGGGIYCEDGRLVLTDCDFIGNVGGEGGALSLSGAASCDVSLYGCVFSGNSSSFGGAISIFRGNLTIGDSAARSTSFVGNTAEYGGAVYLGSGGVTLTVNDSSGEYGTALFENNTAVNGSALFTRAGCSVNLCNTQFKGNSSENGTIYAEGGSFLIGDSLFAGNTATVMGAAAAVFSADKFTFDYCTITDNTCSGSAGTVIDSQISLTISNSIVLNRTASEIFMEKSGTTLTLSNVCYDQNNLQLAEGAAVTEDGNIFHYTEGDIVFVNAAEGNYAIDLNSALLNKGTESRCGLSRDLAGNDAVVGPAAELGCYERADDPTIYLRIQDYRGQVDGASHSITVTGAREGDTVYYSQNGENWTTQNPGFTQAGTYTVYVKGVREGSEDFYGSGVVVLLSGQETSSTVVTTLEDVVNPYDGLISLREAVTVYRKSRGSVVSFASGLSGTIKLTEGEIAVDKQMSITGNGNITIDAGGASRIFTVSKAVTISDLTLKNGNGDGGAIYLSADVLLTLSNMNFEANTGAHGGAIYSVGKIAVSDSIFKNNSGTWGGAINSEGTLTITESVFDGNNGSDGGAVNATGTLTIYGSKFTNNGGSSAYGGAICFMAGTFSINPESGKASYKTVFSGNGGSGVRGGAIYVHQGTTVKINTSTAAASFSTAEFSKNQSVYGGAIWMNDAYELEAYNISCIGNVANNGGAVELQGGGTAIFGNSLFADNFAGNAVGCVEVSASVAASFDYCTFAGNSAGAGWANVIYSGSSLTISNSVIVSNLPSEIYMDGAVLLTLTNVCYASESLQLNNGAAVSESGTIYHYQAGDPIFVDAAEGDYTLNPASYLINAGTGNRCGMPYDLAGAQAVYGSAADIGCFEYQNLPCPDIRITSYEGAYDGNAHGVTVSGAISGDKVYYSSDSETWGTAPLTYTDPGAYTVYVKVTRSGYADFLGSGDVIIHDTQEEASTIVTTLLDVVDKYDGLISLREAATVYAAAGDTVTFAEGLAGTITLDSQITIGQNLAIAGNGAITVDGAAATRLFEILAGNVAFSDLTLANGNSGSNWGGAVYVNTGAVLTVQNILFDKNNSGVGGAAAVKGTLNAYNSVFNGGGNSYGGAVYAEYGVLNFTDCDFTSNTGGEGGAISVAFTDVALYGCSFTGNTASYGGVLSMYAGTLTVANSETRSSVFTGNSAERGGVFYFGAGGVTANINCSAENFSTALVSNNTATYGSFVFANDNYNITAYNLSVTGQTAHGGTCNLQGAAGTVFIGNSLFARNTCAGWGAVAEISAGASVKFDSCTLTDNTCNGSIGGTLFHASNSLTISNSIVLNRMASEIYMAVSGTTLTLTNVCYDPNNQQYAEGASVSENGNIFHYTDGDTLFVNAAAGNYDLVTGSYAVDAAADTRCGMPYDLAGKAGVYGPAADLGCYENQGGTVVVLDAPVIATGKQGIYVSYGANRHQIVWNAIENASGYELAYSTDGGSVWTTMTVSETKAVVSGLTYGADVVYKVRALGNGTYTDSEYSAAKTFTVCPMDINNDGDIAGADRTLLGNAWLAEEGDENYLPCCDIDGNEEVSGTDRSFLVKNWLCEVGEDELSYPRPLNADNFFEEYASADLGIDLDLF